MNATLELREKAAILADQATAPVVANWTAQQVYSHLEMLQQENCTEIEGVIEEYDGLRNIPEDYARELCVDIYYCDFCPAWFHNDDPCRWH